MKIIKPSVEFFGALPTDYENALRFIEKAGRTCYKSEDKITDDSAEKFVKKLINAKPYPHLAMIEHSNFVIKNSLNYWPINHDINKFLKDLYYKDCWYIGGNLRAWFEHCKQTGFTSECEPFYAAYGELFNLQMPDCFEMKWETCPHDEIPKELHRYSAKFICDRGVSHELVRHRPCSFAQESTRYVNYCGKDMEFVEPAGYENWSLDAKTTFAASCEYAEFSYGQMINYSLKPQQARAVLPNALKTEIVVTADAAEWQHIKNLRTASGAHPDMQRVMNMMPWESFL